MGGKLVLIEVEMKVTRHKVRREDGIVELWGYVGDYEVMTCISIRDAIEKDVIPGGDSSPQKKDVKRA